MSNLTLTARLLSSSPPDTIDLAMRLWDRATTLEAKRTLLRRLAREASKQGATSAAIVWERAVKDWANEPRPIKLEAYPDSIRMAASIQPGDLYADGSKIRPATRADRVETARYWIRRNLGGVS